MGMPGSPQTVQRLVDEHYVSLYRYAYRLSGSAADAEDLTQETFCKAQLNFAQLRAPERARPWLFSILRNAYLHRIRADKQQPCVSLDGVGDLPEPPPEPFPDVDPEQLQQALNEMDEVFRTPIILYYFEDFGYREIAEQMDLPIGTVMSRLARAKAHLRARLLPAGPPAHPPSSEPNGLTSRPHAGALTSPGRLVPERRATDGL
jgi:RNA polymerase sigma-70 factor (ECF subfamily)